MAPRRVQTALLAALAAAAASPAPAQQGLTHPGEAPLRAGRAALERGDATGAVHHLLEAWVHRPGSPELLELLLAAAADDADARTLWAHAWTAGQADVKGKTRPPAEIRRLLPKDDPHVARIATTRAAAVEELAKLAETRAKKARKNVDELLVSAWAARLARVLAADSPALWDAHAAELSPTLAEPENAHEPVIDALQSAMSSAFSNGRYGDAVRAARSLRGLARQAGLKDLQGPAPKGLDNLERAAAQALARARAELADAMGEPWTVEELEELRGEKGEAFTRLHHTYGRPGVALSPTEKYRVETDCGFETLLGVAKTIELHHDRLARWYGTDPFVDRQGTCRIVPEAHGLESEGVPFWWAGGFQGGDVTTMRFSCGSIESLGHGLTHELTHRFDGALYPGQMAWLTEGKAVWTGAAYGSAQDETFVANHANFGTIERTWIKGYGGRDELEELITGTIEDYRDNYFAGYALYVYLTTWEADGVKPYAERMLPYMEGGARGNREPLAWFTRHFADGKDGRPDSLDAFAERFREFIAGFYWQDRKPWTERYTRELPHAVTNIGYVYDQPTWTWSRVRAEPSFGQDQARAAGELLLELGREKEAAHALVWALGADGRTPAVERRLAPLLRELGRADAAWVLEETLACPSGRVAKPPPFKLGRTRDHLAALRSAAEAYSAGGRRTAAAAFAADHDRLGARLGGEPLALGPPQAPSPLHPFDAPGVRLGGWTEDGLTDYEELRTPELWYAADDGTLHVGRKKPREGTGSIDRRAHQRHAFTRADGWQMPGRYRISCRVQLTTSFVNGALVLGYTRRDRNVRVNFTAGDFLYSIGSSEEGKEIESVGWSVNGLRERDRALPGSRPGGSVEFGRPMTAFELALLVDGAALHVFINGERRGTYHTVDGAPIEGHVGFASGMGAYRVHRPVVERMDRTAFAERAESFAIRLNHALRGDRPAPSHGMLFLHMAQPDDEEEGYEFDPDRWVKKTLRCATTLARLVEKEGVTQPVTLAVSAKLDGEPLAAIRAELAELAAPPEIVLYPWIEPPPEEDADAAKAFDTNWLLLVDPSGVIRVRKGFFGWESEFSERTSHWLTVLRDNGWPERDLPPLERAEPDDQEAGEDA